MCGAHLLRPLYSKILDPPLEVTPRDEVCFIYRNDNNTWFLDSAFPIKIKVLLSVLYPGHWIMYQFCTHSALSLLPGEHSIGMP